MKKSLYIYGAGGLGREVCSLVNALHDWTVAGFIDDNPPSRSVKGIPVLGGMEYLQSLAPGTAVVFAVGNPAAKRSLVERAPATLVAPVLIHPTVVIQDQSSVHIGPGSIICAGVRITCDVIIQSHVLVNLNATIGHDSKIDSFSSIMPGVNIAGEVSIGVCALLGSGANIRNRVVIGDNAVVGMGAVVLNDVPDNLTVGGVPARALSRK